EFSAAFPSSWPASSPACLCHSSTPGNYAKGKDHPPCKAFRLPTLPECACGARGPSSCLSPATTPTLQCLPGTTTHETAQGGCRCCGQYLRAQAQRICPDAEL